MERDSLEGGSAGWIISQIVKTDNWLRTGGRGGGNTKNEF